MDDSARTLDAQRICVTVNSLPSEILLKVFLLTLAHASADEAHKDEANFSELIFSNPELDQEEDMPENWDDTTRRVTSYTTPLPFQVTLSHVCSGWRTLAIGAPDLWTRMEFKDPYPFNLSKLYLERSKSLPLDISIDSIAITPIESEYCKERIRHGVNAPGRLTTRRLAHILEVLLVAIQHVSRWRSCSIVCWGASDASIICNLLGKYPSGAPILETLIISSEFIRRNYLRLEITENLIAQSCPVLFGDRAPRLSNVILRGVRVSPSLFFSNAEMNGVNWKGLTQLELSLVHDPLRPTFGAFARILRDSPLLEHLTLQLAGPSGRMDDDGITPIGMEEWPNVMDPPIVLRALKKLAFASDSAGYAARLIGTLESPVLKSLEISLFSSLLSPRGDGEAGFSACLRRLSAYLHSVPPGLPALAAPTLFNTPRTMLSTVEDLSILGLHAADDALIGFCDSFPSLKHLTIDQRFVPPMLLFSMGYLHLPSLVAVTVISPARCFNGTNEFSSVCSFVEDRSRQGQRIKVTLRLEEGDTRDYSFLTDRLDSWELGPRVKKLRVLTDPEQEDEGF